MSQTYRFLLTEFMLLTKSGSCITMFLHTLNIRKTSEQEWLELFVVSTRLGWPCQKYVISAQAVGTCLTRLRKSFCPLSWQTDPRKCWRKDTFRWTHSRSDQIAGSLITLGTAYVVRAGRSRQMFPRKPVGLLALVYSTSTSTPVDFFAHFSHVGAGGRE